jgi:hypothetical protein
VKEGLTGATYLSLVFDRLCLPSLTPSHAVNDQHTLSTFIPTCTECICRGAATWPGLPLAGPGSSRLRGGSCA